ncbi:GDYXXLXY domain-containing protein [Myroides sp. WP-1]|uniref:GDYXXLXY domain-containing protein n=1 Tax=Myroides sp. WP-1 TaxID=2759944 RepID=UPI0015FC81D4|nr:GDYXXLXY domain-containing protein [Myroides sp. WP-1]
MKNKRNIVIVITLVLFGIFFLCAVRGKEDTIKEGKLVLLPLAPVDPRSLIQGDYMQLNYAINEQLRATQIDRENLHKRGYIILGVNQQQVGSFQGISQEFPTVKEDSLLPIKYFNWDGFSLAVGAESYFFQEKKDTLYDKAKYGGLRVDQHGNSVLIGLYDEDLKLIE